MASKWVRGRLVVVVLEMGRGGLLLHLEEVLMYNRSLKGSFRGSLETKAAWIPGFLLLFLFCGIPHHHHHYCQPPHCQQQALGLSRGVIEVRGFKRRG